jgi:hypothetical protein
MVFENGALRIIFGPKWEEVAGGWRNYIIGSFIYRRLQQMFYSDKFKEDEIVGTCSRHGRY